MGITTSYEATGRAAAGLRAAAKREKQALTRGSAVKPSRAAGQTLEGCPSQVNPTANIKLNDFAGGDTATCYTTTCGSSLSGASASLDTGTWRTAADSASDQQMTVTLSGEGGVERSLSSQAVSSNPAQSPRGFLPDSASPAAEWEATPSSRPSRWVPRRPPPMHSLFASLRSKAVRCRSQPPPSGSSDAAAAAAEGPSSSSSSRSSNSSGREKAAALQAHIARAEEDHRRRRQTDIDVYFQLSSGRPAREWPDSPRGRTEKQPASRRENGKADSAAAQAADWLLPSIHPAAAHAELGSGRRQTAASRSPSACSQPNRCSLSGRLAPPPAGRFGGSRPCSSWIADMPPDGRWEVERGVWTRQGVHPNNAHVADERFRAIAATKLTPLSPPQTGGGAPSPSRFQGRGAGGPLWGLPPHGAAAGRMTQQQQRRLQQATHQVMPITDRGVAVATTIEIAKRRQAAGERKRPQHLHIAAASSARRYHYRGCGPLDHSADHSAEPARPAQQLLARSHSGLAGTPEQQEESSKRIDAAASRRAASVMPPQNRMQQQAGSHRLTDPQSYEATEGHLLRRMDEMHSTRQADGLACPASSLHAPPSRSRARQQNAFVANPRANIGAPRRGAPQPRGPR
ncbi:hypothetical protein Efla_000580 [Eimeria flavescens]